MSKYKGFTLVELLIAVAIVAILAAYASPSYLEYTRKAKRSTAKQVLLEAVARQETFRAQTLGYGRNMTNLGYGSNALITPDGFYSVAVSAAAPATGRATSYTITATALGDQAKDKCDGFSIDNVGNRGVTKGTVDLCW